MQTKKEGGGVTKNKWGGKGGRKRLKPAGTSRSKDEHKNHTPIYDEGMQLRTGRSPRGKYR